jgi:hypothetical protein
MARRAKKGGKLARRVKPAVRPATRAGVRGVGGGGPVMVLSPRETEAYREVFWQNIVRDILGELSMMCALKPGADGKPVECPESERDEGGELLAYDPALFDGRMGVITETGERIAIAHVRPLVGAGAAGVEHRGLAMAVDSSIFQITTPEGHLLTVPLQHIRAFHAVSGELMERLQRRAARGPRGPRVRRESVPFGFAAFTSLARGVDEGGALPGVPATMDPQE